MTPNQKMTGENGLQNALFPLTYLVVTNGENAGDVPGTTGHNGRMIIDFSGWGESGKYINVHYMLHVTLNVYM